MGDDGAMDVSEYDEDEDIYGDLESDIFSAPAKRPRIEDLIVLEEYQNLKTENHTLKIKMKQLEKENKYYSSNISALYLTAKSEIDKKNFIIKNLTEKMKQVTKSKSNLSDKEAEEILIRCQEALQESQSQVTLNEIQKCFRNVSPTKAGKRKLIKWGNMSFYYFREQGSFHRKEMVTFPKDSKSTTVSTNGDQEKTSHDFGKSAAEEKGESNEEQNKKNRITADISCPTSIVNMNKGYHEDRVSKANDFPAHVQEICETDTKRERRNSGKDINRIECDRDKINQRTSGDRYSLRNTRSRDPSNDRRQCRRKNEEDRNQLRTKEYEGRKSDNRRQNSWSNHDSHSRPSRRFKNDGKYSNSNSSYNSRSRSKSK